MIILSFYVTTRYRRKNYCNNSRFSELSHDNYYKNGPGRRLKAVALHSSYGQHNTKAYPRHINNEAAMSHTETFLLPCGKTLGHSWGASRMAWHGFKIANGNNDTQKKIHYSRIYKNSSYLFKRFCLISYSNTPTLTTNANNL